MKRSAIWVLLFLVVSSNAFGGAWGIGYFQNDTALDFWSDLKEQHGGITGLMVPIQKVIRAENSYLNADYCNTAIAAAALIASMKDDSMADLPPEGIEWVRTHRKLYEAKMATDAVSALEKIVEGSELKELWRESPDYKKWMALIQQLLQRLKTT